MGNVHIIIKPKAYLLAGILVVGGIVAALAPRMRQSLAQAAPAQTPSSPSNVLKNPGFEEVKGKLPVSWTGWVKGKSDPSVVAYAETLHTPHSGIYHGTHYGGTDYNAYTFQIATNLPEGDYTLRAWVQSTGGQQVARMQAEQFDAAGTKKTIAIPQVEGEWRQIEITGIHVTRGQCMVGFWSESPGSRWIMFDDVELIKTP